MGCVKKHKLVLALSILACSALLLSQPTMAGAAAAAFPQEFSPSLSFGGESLENQATEYIIALDSSGSMDDSIAARNAAASALIQSLPGGNTSATAFFFSNTCETPLGILPMDEDEARQNLATTVEKSTSTGGGTDLGLMMRTAVGLFGGEGADPSVRHILFVITDGQSDGENGLAEIRDQEFFSLCQAYRDTVCTYVIYISDDVLPDSLCRGLRTEPITLEDNNPDTLAACAERLASQEPGELAKVLSISNFDLLETALLLCLSTGDDVFCRVVDQDAVIDFEIPPFCIQTLTIALSGGVSVREALSGLKQEGSETDLLDIAEIGAAPSIAAIHSEGGLPPGRYTMSVKTDTPLSIVVSYQCNFQIQYGLDGLDQPLSPPAGTQTTLHMRLLDPNGMPLESFGSLELSMNIYRKLENGTSEWYALVKNGGTFSAAGLEEAEQLQFYPVVSYSGKQVELDKSWDIQLSEAGLDPVPGLSQEPIPSQNPNPGPSSKLPGTAFIFFAIAGLLIAVSAILYAHHRVLREKQQNGARWEHRLASDEAEREIAITDNLLQAGIRWQLVDSKKEMCLLGGVGLTDADGNPRGGCDLGKMKMWCLDGPKSLKLEENPLKFCRWRYSPRRKCTELILQLPDIEITSTGDLLTWQCEGEEPSSGTYRFFGVDRTHRYGTVSFVWEQWAVSFQLEYYMDGEPFIYEGEKR